ncbi:MAG: glycosyltransferase [Leptolyngbyaceae bacterium]|nr:glycosyltransferase [Leptolyngbyaceae bacterium]
MITITLGTIPFQFNRAINWIHVLIERGIITEPIFIQHGVSNVLFLKKYPFVTTAPILESKNMRAISQASRMIISHAGQGSTRSLVSQNSRFVLLPRLAKYGEHIDDHQLFFARSIEPLGVRYCLTLEELKYAILNPPNPVNSGFLQEPKLANHLLKIYPPGQEVEVKSLSSQDQNSIKF